MGMIALEGMKYYAYHGLYEEERLIGTDYVVDVYIRTKMVQARKMDQLSDTVNYETVYRLVSREMKTPRNLIEHVAERILDALKFQFAQMSGALIRIKKMNPPLQGTVSNSFVEIEENFMKRCANCRKPLTCYRNKNCWCKEIDILPGIEEEFINKGSCLCANCLDEMSEY